MKFATPPGRSPFRTALCVLLLLIVYGSLYPLRWDFAHPQPFIVRGRIGLTDLVENVVLFLPLGWLLVWGYRGHRRFWAVQWAWFAVSVALAALLQWLQVYLPRTPALSDIVFNAAGHGLGVAFGLLFSGVVERLQQRHQAWAGLDRFALVLVMLFIVAELFPLIPTMDRSTVAANVKALWQTPWWQPQRMLNHLGMTLIGLSALAAVLRSVGMAHRVGRAALLALFLLLLGKFIVLHQTPGAAVPIGIAAAAALWASVDGKSERARATLVLLAALFGYLVFALAPYGDWRMEPAPMRWIPFASSLDTSIEGVITSVAFECLVYGAFVWAALRMGASASVMTVLIATLALACEWLQRYLPGRTPEITSLLLALGMGWLAAVLARAGPRARQWPPR